MLTDTALLVQLRPSGDDEMVAWPCAENGALELRCLRLKLVVALDAWSAGGRSESSVKGSESIGMQPMWYVIRKTSLDHFHPL